MLDRLSCRFTTFVYTPDPVNRTQKNSTFFSSESSHTSDFFLGRNKKLIFLTRPCSTHKNFLCVFRGTKNYNKILCIFRDSNTKIKIRVCGRKKHTFFSRGFTRLVKTQLFFLSFTGRDLKIEIFIEKN